MSVVLKVLNRTVVSALFLFPSLSFGSACPGGNVIEDPGPYGYNIPGPTNSISLTGASRADLAARCSGNSNIAVGSQTAANVFVVGASDAGPNPCGKCNIRFDLSLATSTPYAGRTIMHCHILEHEDQGVAPARGPTP